MPAWVVRWARAGNNWNHYRNCGSCSTLNTMGILAVVQWTSTESLVVSDSSFTIVQTSELKSHLLANAESICLFHEEALRKYVPQDAWHIYALMTPSTVQCIQWARYPIQEWAKRHSNSFVHGAYEEAYMILQIHKQYVQTRRDLSPGRRRCTSRG